MADDPTTGTPGEAPDASRRTFLTTSAAIAGAAAVFGLAGRARAGQPWYDATPLGATVPAGKLRTVTDGRTIRMGLIGPGGMGRGHCQAFANFHKTGQADVEIVAVSDCSIPQMKRGKEIIDAEWNNDCAMHQNYKDLLAREDINAVLIASPEHWHAQHIIDALTAGKDVYTEKPMTLRFSQAMDVRKTVLAHPDQIFQVGTQMMMIPKYGKARQAIKDGKIGKPIWSQTSYCRNSKDGEWNYYELGLGGEPGKDLDWDAWCGYMGRQPWDPKVYARWRRYRKFSTGIIGDLLVHVMTPLIYALDQGWPTRVVGTGGRYIDLDMENHDQVNIQAQFEGGHTMVVAGSTDNEVGLETMIRGHKANMYLNGRHVQIRPERIFVDDVDEEEIQCEDIGNDQDRLRLNWLECLRSREPAASNIDLASKVMVIVDAATRSMWDGKAYTFDPDTMRVEPA